MIAGRSPAEFRKFTAFKKNNIKLPPYTYKNSTEKAGSRLDRHPGIRVLVTDKIFFPDKIIFFRCKMSNLFA